MAKSKLSAGGGWPAVRYSFKMARKAGGILKLFKALHSKNTCKTCALGMGGQNGGMRNELGEGFQVCKKSMQAQAQDMHGAVTDAFWSRHSVDDLRNWSGRELESAGRLVKPLYHKKGATHFKVLSWEESTSLLLNRWRAADPQRSFLYTSGRSSMEAAFIVQLLGRQWGTNNINNCSYYCHQASGVGLKKSLGDGTATVNLEDVQKARLVIVIGANPSSNHPRFMAHLAHVRRKGGHVVVVNPFVELGLQRFKIPSDPHSLLLGSDIASLYIQPHCGGDLSFLKAAALYLYQSAKYDKDYLAKYCDGTEHFLNDLQKEDLQNLLNQSGVDSQSFKTFCSLLTQSENTIFAWAMGITHHSYGTETVQAVANLALMLGAVGKPGSGLLPLRGHSNVQGVGTVGVVPGLKPEMAGALVKRFNITIPAKPGLDTYQCMVEAHEGNIDFAILLGGNLYGSNPDSSWAEKSLSNIRFKCQISTSLNQGHVYGLGEETLIIPVRTRDEEQQSTSQESMFNFVRLSLGGNKCPHEQLPSETTLFSDIGVQLLGKEPVPWDEMHNHQKIRQYIAEVVPDMAPLSAIEGGRDFSIPGRIKHQPVFNTNNNKAFLEVIAARDARPETGNFNMTTFRSEGQFNTIVYDEEDIYRGVRHRMVIFMNKQDMQNLELNEGQKVTVQSTIGSMQVEAVAGPIRQGNTAMYWPEANRIVPRNLDPLSKTPSFKKVSVKIHPA
jgi:molybdopterin-dependent oxidoreductase alpha subunit